MRKTTFGILLACLAACDGSVAPSGGWVASAVTATATAPGGSAGYTLPASAYVSLNIYDATGAIVRELKRREWQAAGDHVVYWDGNDNGGAALPPDQPYTWKLLANPGTLQAQYVMSLGTSYPRGDQERYMGPGSHESPAAVAVDATGMYVAAKRTENIETALLKQPLDGSSRIWTALQPRAWDGALALASANGTVYMLGYSADAGDPAKNKPPVAQWLYKYKAVAPTTTGEFKLGVSPDGTGNALADGNGGVAEVPGNHIDVSWDSSTVGRADATDMDANGDNVVVAYAAKNAIRWYDQATGQITTVTVTAPAGVTVSNDGAAYVSSGTRILRVTKTGARTIFASGLQGPGVLDIDHANGRLFVYETQRSQVRRYNLANGFWLNIYGARGGRQAGPYNAAAKTSFSHVADLTADQQGGFLVAEKAVAPRRVARFDSLGHLVQEWYGGQTWSPCAMIDPDDARVVWMHSSTEGGQDFMRLSVDYANRTWAVDSTYQYFGLASGLVTWGENAQADTYELIKHDGKTYIAKSGWAFTVLEVDDANTRLRPVTVVGNVANVPAGTAAATIIQGNAGGNRSFQWNDDNADGNIQAAEVHYFPNPCPDTTGQFIPNVDANGDYYGVLDDHTGPGGLKMFKYGASWEGDIPKYSSFPAGEYVFSMPPRWQGRVDLRWSTFNHHDRSKSGDVVYAAMNARLSGDLGLADDPFLYKWNSGPTGSWQVGGKSAVTGPPSPGLVQGGFRRFAGATTQPLGSPAPAGSKVTSVILQDLEAASGWNLTQTTALTYVWDEDGLWVGNVFDSVDGASPWYMYLGGGEFLQGQVYTDPVTSEVFYYGNWENETRVWKISGFGNWSKQSGDVVAGVGSAPSIEVACGEVTIPNGDTSPSAAEGTDFGSGPIGARAAERTFTIYNTGTADLNLTGTPAVSFTGTYGGDFVVGAPPAANIPPGTSAQFTVRFIPTGAGDRGKPDPAMPAANLSTAVIGNSAAGGAGSYTFALGGSGDPDGSAIPFVTGIALDSNQAPFQAAGLLGMSIQIGALPLSVTALGRWVVPGNQEAHQLSIVDASTSLPLPGGTAVVQTAGAAGNQFNYASLPSPLTLLANHRYYILSRESTDFTYPDRFYVTTTGVAQTTGAVGGNDKRADGRWFQDPAWPAYGPVNFQYRAALPIGWWKLDEASGAVAVDSSGTGNQGAVTGGAWLPTGGHIGGALSCDGTSTVVTLPSNLVESPSYSTLTAAAWIKTSASGVIMAAQNTPLGELPGNYEALLYVGLDGKARGSVWPSPVLTSPSAVNDDTWHHLALEVSDAGQALYVDGSLVATSGWSLHPLGQIYNQLGAAYNNSASGWTSLSTTTGWFHYQGLLDDVRFYGMALSAADVAALAAM